MKKTLCLSFLVILVLSVFSCPSYQLADKTEEELEQEFNTVIDEIDGCFNDLLSNFGQHAYPEFKKLVSEWVTLYTKYECWADITRKNIAKTPMKMDENWLDELKDISTSLGKGINLFIKKDMKNSKRLVEESRVEYITKVKGTLFNEESDLIKNISEYLRNKDWDRLRDYLGRYRATADNILDNIRKHAYDSEYYEKANEFYKKLSSVIDNDEKLDYTKEELEKLLGSYSLYRFNNSSDIKRMWVEVMKK